MLVCGNPHSELFDFVLSHLQFNILKKFRDLAFLSFIVYIKEQKAQICKDICTLMFISALFTIAKMRKQCKYPMTDE